MVIIQSHLFFSLRQENCAGIQSRSCRQHTQRAWCGLQGYSHGLASPRRQCGGHHWPRPDSGVNARDTPCAVTKLQLRVATRLSTKRTTRKETPMCTSMCVWWPHFRDRSAISMAILIMIKASSEDLQRCAPNWCLLMHPFKALDRRCSCHLLVMRYNACEVLIGLWASAACSSPPPFGIRTKSMCAKSSAVSSKKRWIQNVKCGVQKSLSLQNITLCTVLGGASALNAPKIAWIFNGPGLTQQEALSEGLGRSSPSFSEDFVLPSLFQSRMDLISSGLQLPISVTDSISELLCVPFPFELVEKGGWLIRSKRDQSVIVFSPLCDYPFLSPTLKLL